MKKSLTSSLTSNHPTLFRNIPLHQRIDDLCIRSPFVQVPILTPDFNEVTEEYVATCTRHFHSVIGTELSR